MGYKSKKSKKVGGGYRSKKRTSASLKNPWHIILTSQGKQLEDLYYTNTEEKVNKKFNKMLADNKKNVRFPIRCLICEHYVYEADYELVIIKRKENDPTSKEVRDDNGNIIEYSSSSDNWIIYDRAPYDVEETFWVYGFHPKMQRKDYNWIYDNFIKKDKDNKSNLRTVAIFKNKLLIDGSEKLEMVICKNKSDCIRMYNEIENDVKKGKIKNVIFMGDVWESKSRKFWYDKVADLTHWKWKKIIRHTTRP